MRNKRSMILKRKILPLLTALILIFAFSSCNKNNKNGPTDGAGDIITDTV